MGRDWKDVSRTIRLDATTNLYHRSSGGHFRPPPNDGGTSIEFSMGKAKKATVGQEDREEIG
jgi:hypothetical protein